MNSLNNLRARAEAFLANISANALDYLFPGRENRAKMESFLAKTSTFALDCLFPGMENVSSQDGVKTNCPEVAFQGARPYPDPACGKIIFNELTEYPVSPSFINGRPSPQGQRREEVEGDKSCIHKQLRELAASVLQDRDDSESRIPPNPEKSSEPELDWKTIAIQKEIEQLQRKYGITVEELTAMINYKVKLSHLHISASKGIFLDDFDFKEVKMDTLTKSLYFLFLNHPEGINFKDMSDHQRELEEIYSSLSRRDSIEGIRRSVATLCNPLDNSINEKVSRVKKAFRDVVDDRVARFYYIDGKKGETKTIVLDRSLVIRD